ncbi:hypothetical protein GCM10009119_36960 [Algoriphagus jejuensis]|uniref:Response regulatory domain-containing protein n=1 Tax=Algoriphagus jejuensis TaxID=419934 RepID=A0ABP3YJ28_9BACT
MRVLLVDDDSVHLFILKKIFEKSNDEVVVARNGKEALQILEFDATFHVIVTEIIMPVMGGFEFLEHLKVSTRTSEIPTIGLTTGDVDSFRIEGEHQFNCLISKPMDFDELCHLAKVTAQAQIDEGFLAREL